MYVGTWILILDRYLLQFLAFFSFSMPAFVTWKLSLIDWQRTCLTPLLLPSHLSGVVFKVRDDDKHSICAEMIIFLQAFGPVIWTGGYT